MRYDGQSYYYESVVDITVTQVVRADAAWEMVRGFNRYNDKPDENQEYIIAYVHTAAIESLDGKAADISDYDFSFISASGVQYDHTSVAGKTPELKTLFEGAEYEGLVIGLIEKGDHPFLVYLPSSDNPLWFDLNRRVPIELPEDMVFEVLENGSRGEAVQRLQAMLVEMGYLLRRAGRRLRKEHGRGGCGLSAGNEPRGDRHRGRTDAAPDFDGDYPET